MQDRHYSEDPQECLYQLLSRFLDPSSKNVSLRALFLLRHLTFLTRVPRDGRLPNRRLAHSTNFGILMKHLKVHHQCCMMSCRLTAVRRWWDWWLRPVYWRQQAPCPGWGWPGDAPPAWAAGRWRRTESTRWTRCRWPQCRLWATSAQSEK